MAATSSLSPGVSLCVRALNQVNSHFKEKGASFEVTFSRPFTRGKDPVFLCLKYLDGTTREIGIVHLVELEGSTWLLEPYEAIAKNLDDVVKAMLERIKLFARSERMDTRYIHESSGTIFEFGTCDVKIGNDDTFLVNGKQVTLGGVPFRFSHIRSEGVIVVKQEDGHIEFLDALDRRIGQRLCIDSEGRVFKK